MIENIGNGMIKVGVKQEELEDSISGLTQLKPILQRQVVLCNGRNRAQGIKDADEAIPIDNARNIDFLGRE